MKGLSRSGQAALEYVLALASLLVVVGLLAGLVGAAGRHAARTESLVAGDCPSDNHSGCSVDDKLYCLIQQEIKNIF